MKPSDACERRDDAAPVITLKLVRPDPAERSAQLMLPLSWARLAEEAKPVMHWAFDLSPERIAWLARHGRGIRVMIEPREAGPPGIITTVV